MQKHREMPNRYYAVMTPVSFGICDKAETLYGAVVNRPAYECCIIGADDLQFLGREAQNTISGSVYPRPDIPRLARPANGEYLAGTFLRAEGQGTANLPEMIPCDVWAISALNGWALANSVEEMIGLVIQKKFKFPVIRNCPERVSAAL